MKKMVAMVAAMITMISFAYAEYAFAGDAVTKFVYLDLPDNWYIEEIDGAPTIIKTDYYNRPTFQAFFEELPIEGKSFDDIVAEYDTYFQNFISIQKLTRGLKIANTTEVPFSNYTLQYAFGVQMTEEGRFFVALSAIPGNGAILRIIMVSNDSYHVRNDIDWLLSLVVPAEE